MAAAFRKARPGAPPGFFACEAAGLRWLAVGDGGARVVRVLDVDESHLDLERLEPTAPSASAAEDLGRGLAATHAAGARAFGTPPDGWTGDGFFGPVADPWPLPAGTHGAWGEFYAERRVRQVHRLLAAQGSLRPGTGARLDRLAARLEAGTSDDAARPARLHGDLWSGNVVWTADGAVLIDPAAHGGHPVTDLAMLALFGAPYLSRILAAYAEHAALPDGWRDLVALHQLYPVGMHALLFGGGYHHQLDDLLSRYA